MTRKSIILRKAEENDIDIIHKWWTNGEIMYPVGFPDGLIISPNEVYESIKRYQNSENSEFLIILNQSDMEIGEFAYSKISNDTYTFDIKIGEVSYQGKGYGKKALLEGIKIIKDQDNVKRIEIGVAPENKIALALYKSVGFKTLRIIKDNWVDQLGKNRSTEILELFI